MRAAAIIIQRKWRATLSVRGARENLKVSVNKHLHRPMLGNKIERILEIELCIVLHISGVVH
jgi:hypothetical protein